MRAVDASEMNANHNSGRSAVNKALIIQRSRVIVYVNHQALHSLSTSPASTSCSSGPCLCYDGSIYLFQKTFTEQFTATTYQHIPRYQQKRKSSKKRKSSSTDTSSLVKDRKHPGGTHSPQTPFAGTYIPISSDTSSCIVSTTLFPLVFCPTNGVHLS
jgi:hypothetical protein